MKKAIVTPMIKPMVIKKKIPILDSQFGVDNQTPSSLFLKNKKTAKGKILVHAAEEAFGWY